MPNTYEPIATTTTASEQGTITFSSIPQTYTDLVLVAKASVNYTSAVSMMLNFNTDATANYSYTRLYGSGTANGSDTGSNQSAGYIGIIGYSAIASAGNFIINIMNYSNTTTHKPIVSRSSDASTGGYVSQYSTIWKSTSAINRIDITFGSVGNLRNALAGSQFTLYGIKAA